MSSSHTTFPINVSLYLITAAFWYLLQKDFRPETQQHQPDGEAQVTGCQESKYKNGLTHCKFVAHMQDILVSVCLRFSAMVF